MTDTDPTRQLFAVTDVETNGLDANKNYLLEVAVIVVTEELEVVDDIGFEAVVFYTPEERERIIAETVPYVQGMHTDNGLWHHLEHGPVQALDAIDTNLRRYLSEFGLAPRSMPLMGNSPRLDLNFLDVHLPQTAMELSYRMIDVSTVAALSHGWHGTEWFPKTSNHRAMDDVRACIEELRYYRKASFK